jgi:hypothetical protein
LRNSSDQDRESDQVRGYGPDNAQLDQLGLIVFPPIPHIFRSRMCWRQFECSQCAVMRSGANREAIKL